MKIAILTDTHAGARGDSHGFAEYFNRFYQEVFFKYIDEHQITTVWHGGDILDRRKYVNYLTGKRLEEDFIKPCFDRKLDLHILVGNHDTYYKNTNRPNSIRTLYGHSKYTEYLSWYESPAEIKFDNTNVLFLPWINQGNYEESLKAIQESNARIVLGHLEIQGFQMYKGAFNDIGFSPSMFQRFELVLSGHFHHRSARDNIRYLGSTYEMNWSDYNDPRGFHVLDTDTLELEYIQNPYRMFHKIFYDDVKDNNDDLLKMNLEHLKDTYVKVVVKNKKNPYLFDRFIDRIINEFPPVNIQTVEDNYHLDSMDEDDIISEVEDTVTMIKKYIYQNQMENPKQLEELFYTLYHEAISLD